MPMKKITDLLISEYYAFPQLMKRLLRDRELLGLRNIILLQSPMGGEFGVPVLELIRNVNKELFREMPGSLLMEDLMQKYEGFPSHTAMAGNSMGVPPAARTPAFTASAILSMFI